MKDTARVLGRTYDGIEYRGFAQETVETLAAYAGVPVWNGLTDEFHPTQILADVLTMTEHNYKNLPEIAYCFMGDARNNMGHSLMLVGWGSGTGEASSPLRALLATRSDETGLGRTNRGPTRRFGCPSGNGSFKRK
jgi:ornithine carbamoyltransferase